MSFSDTPFLKTIKHLRTEEEIVLYANIPTIIPQEEELIQEFLKDEYTKEATNYPYSPPTFNKEAALWAAKTIYFSSQFLLYRENKGNELPLYLPPYSLTVDAPSVLSTDICLRFLPDILENLTGIDPEDPIVLLLEDFMYQWHYSAVGYRLNPEKLSINEVYENKCLRQLYVDRIIEKKAKELAGLPFFNSHIKASIGEFGSLFWKDL